MIVLFDTPAGYSLFKVTNEKKLAKTDAEDIHKKFFSTASDATSFVNLVSFQPFQDTADAVSAATACIEGKVSKTLKSFLKKQIKNKNLKGESLAIVDKNLAVDMKDKVSGLDIVSDGKTLELFRGIRTYIDDLLEDSSEPAPTGADIRAMQLGLSHSLSRYKLKFSADKVDTMVIQAVGLLDELDKEINTYAMRVKEWYGWHFPELQAIANDNAQYSKTVLAAGFRTNIKNTDLSAIFEDESHEKQVKDAAEVSMGTEIADMDILNIQALAEQVLSMTEYRIQLFEYLKNRMNAIAPNLTILVGELVGARLISHAGSLMNLAKQPASTVQILGAEKALFRALKTKHDTPKYGLIYHASLIGQAAPKNKGKISRVLAAKAALATRVDALSDETADMVDTTIGYEGRAKVEARLRSLEGGDGAVVKAVNTNGLTAKKTSVYTPKASKPSYNDSNDVVLGDGDGDSAEKKSAKKDKKKKKDKKRKAEDVEEENGEAVEEPSAKKSKKDKKKKDKKSKKDKK